MEILLAVTSSLLLPISAIGRLEEITMEEISMQVWGHLIQTFLQIFTQLARVQWNLIRTPEVEYLIKGLQEPVEA
jgi:hypothetical protein